MILEAGTYYIGDPCYAFSDDGWQNFLNETDDLENVPKNFWCARTYYGDGVYSLLSPLSPSERFDIAVDSGLIGCVPIDMATEHSDNALLKMTFNKRFLAEEIDGVFYIGDVVVDTKGESEEY